MIRTLPADSQEFSRSVQVHIDIDGNSLRWIFFARTNNYVAYQLPRPMIESTPLVGRLVLRVAMVSCGIDSITTPAVTQTFWLLLGFQCNVGMTVHIFSLSRNAKSRMSLHDINSDQRVRNILQIGWVVFVFRVDYLDLLEGLVPPRRPYLCQDNRRV